MAAPLKHWPPNDLSTSRRTTFHSKDRQRGREGDKERKEEKREGWSTAWDDTSAREDSYSSGSSASTAGSLVLKGNCPTLSCEGLGLSATAAQPSRTRTFQPQWQEEECGAYAAASDKSQETKILQGRVWGTSRYTHIHMFG